MATNDIVILREKSINGNAEFVSEAITLVKGDLIYGYDDGTNIIPTRLGIGSSSNVLTVVDGYPAWDTPTNGSHTQGTDPGTTASTWIINSDGTLIQKLNLIYDDNGTLDIKTSAAVETWANIVVRNITANAINGVTLSTTGNIVSSNGSLNAATGLNVTGPSVFTGNISSTSHTIELGDGYGSGGTTLIDTDIFRATAKRLVLNYDDGGDDAQTAGFIVDSPYGEIGLIIDDNTKGLIQAAKWVSNVDIDIETGGSYQIGGAVVLGWDEDNQTLSLGGNVTMSYLQTVGTISTGTWQGTPVTGYFGGTDLKEVDFTGANKAKILGMGWSDNPSALELKSLNAGTGISITPGLKSLTIANTLTSETFKVKVNGTVGDAYANYLSSVIIESNTSGIKLTPTGSNTNTMVIGISGSYFTAATSITRDESSLNVSYIHMHDASSAATPKKIKMAELFRSYLVQQTPANTGSGTKGDMILGANDDYLYVCTATNVWKRIPLSTF